MTKRGPSSGLSSLTCWGFFHEASKVLACWPGLETQTLSPPSMSTGEEGEGPRPPRSRSPGQYRHRHTCIHRNTHSARAWMHSHTHSHPQTHMCTRMHTRTCTPVYVGGEGLYGSRGLCRPLAQANADALWAAWGRAAGLAIGFGFLAGKREEGPRRADGVDVVGWDVRRL